MCACMWKDQRLFGVMLELADVTELKRHWAAGIWRGLYQHHKRKQNFQELKGTEPSSFITKPTTQIFTVNPLTRRRWRRTLTLWMQSTTEVIEQPSAPCVPQKTLLADLSSCDRKDTEPEAGDMDAKAHQLQRQKMEAGQRNQDNKTRIEQLEEHLAEFIQRTVRYETDIQMLKDRNQELGEKCVTTAQRRDVLVQQVQDISAKKLDLELRLQRVEEDTKDVVELCQQLMKKKKKSRLFTFFKNLKKNLVRIWRGTTKVDENVAKCDVGISICCG